MFKGSRKHRPPIQPLTKETANPNAATAAASAFMRREPSAPSLSSAAAAAALKARPTTPINVAQVQSKRAMRRSPSVSSVASRDRTPRREVQRSPSVGSMNERTFRSPSPGRSPAPRRHDVPPVPSLPLQREQLAPKSKPAGPPTRSTNTLQTQPFRTASQKLKDGQQGASWFGGAAGGDMSNVRKSDAVLQTFVSAPLPEQRPGSVSPSINFSYPRSQVDSPDRPRSTSISDQTTVYDPNSRRMVPRVDPTPHQESVRLVSAPTKQGVSRSGSHLSKGTIGRTKAPALETIPSSAQAKPTPTPVSVLKEPQSLSREQTLVEPKAEPDQPAKYDTRASDGATVLSPAALPHASALGQRTIAEEDVAFEDESAQDREGTSHTRVSEAIDSVPSKSSFAESQDRTIDDSTVNGKSVVEEKPQAAEIRQHSSIRGARVHSESPARTAHFASSTDQLAVRHEPPPRSLSPRKSAMKYGSQSSVRGISPSDDGSEVSGAGLSVIPRNETAAARKKRVRVSFDDQKTVVLGEAAPKPDVDSPVIPSPQSAKKPWLGIVGRFNKKDPVALEDDETMTPRPALPLFGSVREKKTRDTEERPLVRPSERPWSPLPPGTLQHASPANSPEPDQGQSSDVGVGSVFSMEQASRNEANISKYREPLPPVVTSMEGSGYVSHSDLSSDDEELGFEDTVESEELAPEDVQEVSGTSELSQAAKGPVLANDDADTEARPAEDMLNIAISITQPSPLGRPASGPEKSYFGVPGGFPEDDSTEPSDEFSSPLTDQDASPPLTSNLKPMVSPEEITADVARQEPGMEESEPIEPEPVTPTRATESPTIIPTPIMTNIQEEEEDGSSIYSDAYEDLSDAEGDGFMSLNAVLTTPIKRRVSQKLYEKTMSHAEENRQANLNLKSSARESKGAPLETPDDWDMAKVYWRSLTIEKRRQLEKEAMEEAGEEAELEEKRKPKRKSKRRSVSGPAAVALSEAPTTLDHPLDSQRIYQIQPGTKWQADEPARPASSHGTGTGKLRKSMRGAAPPPEIRASQAQVGGGMRKSLRSGAPSTSDSSEGQKRQTLRSEPEATAAPATGMRKSLRSNDSDIDILAPRPSVKKTGRPVSYQPTPTAQTVNTHVRNRSADPRRPSTATTPSAVKPSLQRRGSNDSESSFTRVRASKGAGLGFKSMRGSLREPPAPAPEFTRGNHRLSMRDPAPEATKGSGRFSLRSLSPRRNSNTTAPPTATLGSVRQSLRSSSSDAGASRKRFSGLGKTKKTNTKPKSNRFDDSSDEDDGPVSFRSRFVDSSDEEEETPRPQSSGRGMNRTMRSNKSSNSAAAAAMGVPASRIRSESPDLPDSDDEFVFSRRPATSNGLPGGRPAQGLQRSRSGRGTLVASPAPGAIGTENIGTNRPANQRRGSLMSILRRKKDPAGKISREVTESAARRDTKLERSAEQLTMMRSNSSPRLQKPAPNWPLPSPVDAEPEPSQDIVFDEARPSTAGSPVTGPPTRAGFLRRRSTSQSVTNTNVGSVAEDGTPKKKKFGTLRKMFKLND